jgi:hypothetical protein
MNREALTTIDHTFLPKESILMAQRCDGIADVVGVLPVQEGVEEAREVSFRSLVMRHNGPNKEYGGTDEHPIYWPAYFFLIDAGCPVEDIEKVMDRHSQLLLPVFREKGELISVQVSDTNELSNPQPPEFEKIPDIYGLSLQELTHVLETRLSSLYALANLSLDSEFEHGFNRHGIEHIRTVATRAVRLLQDLGYDEMTQKLALIMAYGHDLGNVFTRKYHSLASPYLLETYIPELHQDESHWAEIVTGIELHNEPVADAFIKKQVAGGKSEEEAYGMLSEATRAVIVADKTHVDANRVSSKIQYLLRALDSDYHVEVNYLLETNKAGIDRKGVYLWSMEKRETMSTENQEYLRDLLAIYSNLADNSFINKYTETYGFPTSKFTHDEHKKKGILHTNTLDASLFALYDRRNVLAIRSLFAFPQINEVHIEIVDPIRNRAVPHIFTREGLDQQIADVLSWAKSEQSKRERYKEEQKLLEMQKRERT